MTELVGFTDLWVYTYSDFCQKWCGFLANRT